jgi:hypothetical protein
MRTYSLTAWIDTSRPEAIERALQDLSPRKKIIPTDVGFFLKAKVRGANARVLNRTLLSGLRRIEPRTSLHAEWKSETSTMWFFNYLQKRSRKNDHVSGLNLNRAGPSNKRVRHGRRKNSI